MPFRKPPAYRFSIQHSSYVHPERLGSGVGRALLPALIERSAEAGYRQLIGYIDAANTVSLKLHEACGFTAVGRLPAVACKFDHWADTIMVQRSLGQGCETVPDPWGRRGPVAAPPPG